VGRLQHGNTPAMTAQPKGSDQFAASLWRHSAVHLAVGLTIGLYLGGIQNTQGLLQLFNLL